MISSKVLRTQIFSETALSTDSWGKRMGTIALDDLPSVDEPYMSKRQLAFFKQKLRDWLNTMVIENGLYAAQIHEESSRTADLLDQTVEVMNRNLALVNGQRSDKLIQQIRAALQRIEDGTYGYCLSTGEEIGLKRLLAWPIATLSVEAQELRERRMRQFNTG
jgi:DnaK suppressor protein